MTILESLRVPDGVVIGACVVNAVVFNAVIEALPGLGVTGPVAIAVGVAAFFAIAAVTWRCFEIYDARQRGIL
jgi:hypothetical protein